MPGLEHLPLDLVHGIIGYLDMPSIFNLKRTSLALNAFVRFEDLPAHTRAKCLNLADNFPKNQGLWACYRCLKIKPKKEFGQAQCKGSRSKSTHNPPKDRFCLDCGAKEKLYGHMNRIHVAKSKGRALFLCHHCGCYGTPGTRCGPPNAGGGSSFLNKKHSNVKIESNWICWPEKSKSPILGNLPQNVVNKIVSYLPYQDAIMLSISCWILQEKVDFDAVPIYRKSRFLSRLETKVGFEMTGEDLYCSYKPCYACFRFRDHRLFTHDQNKLGSWRINGPTWQRRCRNCLYAMHGSSKPNEELLTKFNSQILCVNCGLLKYIGSQCLGCVENREMGLAADPQAAVAISQDEKAYMVAISRNIGGLNRRMNLESYGNSDPHDDARRQGKRLRLLKTKISGNQEGSRLGRYT